MHLNAARPNEREKELAHTNEQIIARTPRFLSPQTLAYVIWRTAASEREQRSDKKKLQEKRCRQEAMNYKIGNMIWIFFYNFGSDCMPYIKLYVCDLRSMLSPLRFAFFSRRLLAFGDCICVCVVCALISFSLLAFSWLFSVFVVFMCLCVFVYGRYCL